MSTFKASAHVASARASVYDAQTALAQALVSAGREHLPAHTSRQLGVLWNASLALWDDLERMLAGGALNAPTQPGEKTE